MFSSAGIITSNSSSLSAAAESSFSSSIMVGVSKSSPSDFGGAIGAGIGAGVSLMSRASQGLVNKRRLKRLWNWGRLLAEHKLKHPSKLTCQSSTIHRHIMNKNEFRVVRVIRSADWTFLKQALTIWPSGHSSLLNPTSELEIRHVWTYIIYPKNTPHTLNNLPSTVPPGQWTALLRIIAVRYEKQSNIKWL